MLLLKMIANPIDDKCKFYNEVNPKSFTFKAYVKYVSIKNSYLIAYWNHDYIETKIYLNKKKISKSQLEELRSLVVSIDLSPSNNETPKDIKIIADGVCGLYIPKAEFFVKNAIIIQTFDSEGYQLIYL